MNIKIEKSVSLGCYFLTIENESIQIGFTVTVGYDLPSYNKPQTIRVSQNPKSPSSDYAAHVEGMVTAYQLSNEVHNFILNNPLEITSEDADKESLSNLLDSVVSSINQTFC